MAGLRLQNPRQRYAIIDRQKLAELALVGDLKSLAESHSSWLHEMLPSPGKSREEKWSTSIAVGGENFVGRIKELFGTKATGRRIVNDQRTEGADLVLQRRFYA